MRRSLLAPLALALAACGQAVAAPPSGPHAPAAGAEAQLFTMGGGFMFPVENGSRIAITNGWIEPRFADLRSGRSADLDVVVGGDGAVDATTADVTVSYEMLEMAHGAQMLHADALAGGHHIAHIPLGMYGTWKIGVRVDLGGATSTAVLVLSGTGL